MSRAAGWLAASMMLGGGAVSLLHGLLGHHAEAAGLGLVGLTLMAISQMLNVRSATQASQGAESGFGKVIRSA